jgi:hypothetical protein
LFPNSSEPKATLLDGGILGIADSSHMCDKVQTASDFAANLFTLNLKEDHHESEYEYRGRTLTGAGNRDINFVGTKVFKLFRGCIFDRRGYLGANAP